MGGDLETIRPEQARSALGWWLDAGVDFAVQEEPRDWLKPAPRADPAPSGHNETKAVAEAGAANIRIPDPKTVEALKDWLATGADIPMAKGAGRRALPHGPEQAEIMLLCEAPGGNESDRPIAGDAWQLTERMLAAIGFTPDQAYSASLSCVHVPGKKMSPSERALCAEIARRHIRLAAPSRLLLLGDGPLMERFRDASVRVAGPVRPRYSAEIVSDAIAQLSETYAFRFAPAIASRNGSASTATMVVRSANPIRSPPMPQQKSPTRSNAANRPARCVATISPDDCSRASRVRALVERSSCLSLAQAFSMGFRSGE